MKSMTKRRTYFLLVSAVFALGIALRVVPLYWSPDPATLDGLRYAALNRDILSSGHIPFQTIQSDEFGFTLSMVATALVTGTRPLHVAQPFVAVFGAAAPLMGMAFTRRLGRDYGWSPRWTRLAVGVVGLTLALDGIYLRRTGVPDEEAIGLLLVPLLAYATHIALAKRDRRWMALSLLIMGVFPLVHNFSAMIGLLTVTALIALHIAYGESRSATLYALVLGVGFWIYFWGYFTLTQLIGIDMTYSEIVDANPGLLLAWVIVLFLGALWYRKTTPRARQLSYLSPIVIGFLIVSVNAIKPIFPGTVPSPTPILIFVLAFLIPVLFASLSLDDLAGGGRVRPVLLSLFLAPLIITFYLLTAALTPPYFDAVLRAQTFIHPAIFVLAGLGVVQFVRSASLRGNWGRWATVAVVVLLVSAVATVPLAFLNLDTATYPSTVLSSEFSSSSFVVSHVNGEVATEDPLSRVGGYYYGKEKQFTMGPTRNWLQGGPKPSCAVLSRRSWSTTGAHLYPASPAATSPHKYHSLLTNESVVYRNTGRDPVALSIPTNASMTC